MTKIAVINGPNLNLLGVREPEIYGKESLSDINNKLLSLAKKLSLDLRFIQSNAEFELVDYIHQCLVDSVEYIVINPAAFTHTSVALRDALLATAIPFVEVHLSNIYAREEFRSHSWFSDVSLGTITGLGSYGYQLALRYIAHNQSMA